ncbi:MAG: hypothetical protein ACE15D_18595 [Candidatus Eisenbacteria bacterium]
MSVRHTVTRLDPHVTYRVTCNGAVIGTGMRPDTHGVLVFEAPSVTGIRICSEGGMSSIEEPPIEEPERPAPERRRWWERLIGWIRGLLGRL